MNSKNKGFIRIMALLLVLVMLLPALLQIF